MRIVAAACSALVLAGCAALDPHSHPYDQPPISAHLQRDDAVGDCARLFRDADAIVERAGARDAQARRVPGFPYLRVDRFAASLGDRSAELPDGFSPWSELMAWLDRDARAAEHANARDGRIPADGALDACRYQLAVADGARLPDLRAAAHVPDDYSPALRALGLYPLTRLAFAAGIRRWHEETRAVFAADSLVPDGPLRAATVNYAPGGVDDAPAVPRSLAFALPQRSRAQWAQLLLLNAPRLAIETASDDDRIGRLVWADQDGEARVRVSLQEPVAYARVAFARFAGRVVAQLVYVFWFPARPAAGAFDLLAGQLDGIVWRVTLDADFRPLVYDTIHPCGCYHLFFPTERVRARPQPATLDEGMFAPQTVRAPRAGEQIVLHVAARTHYLTRIATEPQDRVAPGTTYAIEPEDVLRRLPLPAGDATRSVYGPNGLIAGSERPERFFFWPMGIASAGQMRQWGRHATAFVGRRHFDDPLLIDRYFEDAAALDAARAGAAGDDLEGGER